MVSAQPDRKAVLLEAAADIVLRDGAAVLGVRTLASRLGTSGRMLLYHFGSRDRLLSEVMARISERLAIVLASHAGEGGLSPGAFLDRVLGLATSPEIAPFMRVWTDIVARAAEGEEPYMRVARGAVEGWIGWIGGRLAPGTDPAAAAAILSVVEGVVLLERARSGTTSGVREYFARALARRV